MDIMTYSKILGSNSVQIGFWEGPQYNCYAIDFLVIMKKFITFTLRYCYYYICTCTFYIVMHDSRDSTLGLVRELRYSSLYAQGPLTSDFISILG